MSQALKTRYDTLPKETVKYKNQTIHTSSMKLRIIIEQDEDGRFVAECPSLPGCISQGKTRQEVLLNIQDAMKGYLISLKKHNEPIPPSITEEVVEVLA